MIISVANGLSQDISEWNVIVGLQEATAEQNC